MRLKSYFAATVEAAMTQARQEMGGDAMLVHTKRLPPGQRHAGEYEVVFALDDTAPQPAPVRAREPRQKDTALDRLADDLGSLRQQVERLATAMGYAAASSGFSPLAQADAAQHFSALVRAGVYPEIAQDLISQANAAGIDLRDSIESSLRTSGWIEPTGGSRCIAALVGPPGAGKTTTLAKMAVVFGLASRVPVQVLSADLHRIGAAEQLRTFCSILGVGFQTVETPLGLDQAIAEYRTKGLILIDTPGLGSRDPVDFGPFATFLASRADVEKHLVLPASMKNDDLSRIASQFAPWGFTHLLFTRMDETSTHGAILNETVRTSRPVSLLSTGQAVPEDLEVPTNGGLASLLLGPETAQQRAARAAA